MLDAPLLLPEHLGLCQFAVPLHQGRVLPHRCVPSVVHLSFAKTLHSSSVVVGLLALHGWHAVHHHLCTVVHGRHRHRLLTDVSDIGHSGPTGHHPRCCSKGRWRIRISDVLLLLRSTNVQNSIEQYFVLLFVNFYELGPHFNLGHDVRGQFRFAVVHEVPHQQHFLQVAEP